ncbi:hypothetical protein LJR289_002544 [Pseudoduganella sp. LjRoot289]|uniref:hypothetical protein n=1 Tax=Pseudoduganella sp. LjRoot289 TaxID=3342314 RepID=UPI003ED1739D
MKIDCRILSSIKRRSGAVVLRRDLANLGRPPQVSESFKTLSQRIPTEGVSQFVANLARESRVTYTRSDVDEWAEDVTRLAGDEVQSDATGDLLVALKRARKLTDREMAALLINHLREKHRVRSV